MKPSDILKFWFEELKPADWWKKSSDLDQKIKVRFLDTHEKALRGELFGWRKLDEGRLAEIIVLDQFSRNIYRDTPQSFAYDPLALVLAQEAVALKVPEKFVPQQRAFFYLPYMHSESLLIHEIALKLYGQEGLEYNLEFEKKHKLIIDRFGRYPHRNEILGRESTPEEIEFLKEPDSSF